MIMLAAALLLSASCDENGDGPTNVIPEPDNGEPTPEVSAVFAKGADISWVTEMEDKGMKFYNASGSETECTALMKEIGFDAIRLRVWVDPKDGYCGKEDVLEKAKRARDLGMRLMIDFHYSDSWADPGKQNIPQAWKDFNAVQMAEAVDKHTTDVLKTLKDNDIEVEWVQVGNEVNSGMLWPSGKVQGNSAENFVRYANAGHDAAKRIYPDVKTILHVSNGQDLDLFHWFFTLMMSQNTRYDMIGMSLYPSWWENGGYTQNYISIINDCIRNIGAVSATFNKPVMLCEIGMPCSEPAMSYEAINHLLCEVMKMEECQGVFYWEPEAPDGYNGGYGLGAFKDGRPTKALDPFKN